MTNGTDSKEVPVIIGINETKDLLNGAMLVAILVITQLKDGLQLYGDFVAVFNKIRSDAAFREAIQEAYNGVGAVPAEIGDIDTAEVIELAGAMMKHLPALLEAIKKQPE